MSSQARGGHSSLFDECKAVLSRFAGLYRGHPAPTDDQVLMDQCKPVLTSTGPRDDLAELTAGMSISPPRSSSPAPSDEAMHLPEDRAHTASQYTYDNTLRDQHHTLLGGSASFPGTPPHPQPHQHLPMHPAPRPLAQGYFNMGESMHSSPSMRSWDANAEIRNAPSLRTCGTATLDGSTGPLDTIKTPVTKVDLDADASPAPPARRPRQVAMYVHATGEPVTREELEHQASMVLSPGTEAAVRAAAQSPVPHVSLAYIRPSQSSGGGSMSTAGVKRLHADSAQVLDLAASPLPRSSAASSAGAAVTAHVSTGLVSPQPHLGMRRTTRPACVPALNLGALPASDSEASYTQLGVHLPRLSETLCQCVDPAQDELQELESWTLPPKWFPPTEGKHYVFKPVTTQEVQRYEQLREAVPAHLTSEVDHMWKELIQARYACELMGSRGVRVVKDVTREWSEMSSHLIQRIEAHEAAAASMQTYVQQQATVIQQLTHQLRVAQAAAAAAVHAQGPSLFGSIWPAAPAAPMTMGYDFNQLEAFADASLQPQMHQQLAAAGPHALRQPRRAMGGNAPPHGSSGHLGLT